MVKTHLIIIDPQNDFCHPDTTKASLYVNGASDDMKRLAAFIRKNKEKLDDIHVTLDSHHQLQVFHPLFWRNSAGDHPAPFTVITVDDVEKGVWSPCIPTLRGRCLDYVKTLDAGKRYGLTIWPYHCLIGSWGTQVVEELYTELMDWERSFIGSVDFITKGSNPYTEHYSAVKAEVPDPMDIGTQISPSLISTLMDADQILFAGEALDYCVYNTLIDVADALGAEQAKKIKILADCTSPIDPNSVSRIKAEFAAKGIEFITTATAF